MTIIDDSMLEGEERFFLLLKVVSEDTINFAGITNTTIIIRVDDDGK